MSISKISMSTLVVTFFTSTKVIFISYSNSCHATMFISASISRSFIAFVTESFIRLFFISSFSRYSSGLTSGSYAIALV